MTISPEKRHLLVMVKEPRAGRVKTRLGADIGMTRAAWWFRHQTRRLIRCLDDPRWTLWLAVSPDRDGLQSRVWPAHVRRIPQGRGTLGDRMGRLFRSLPPGPALIIGGDIPGVTADHVETAFRALGRSDAVFGPAPDGGYWLVGLRRGRIPATLFQGVRWSTSQALSDSEASLQGLRISHVATLRDVDTAKDLRETR